LTSEHVVLQYPNKRIMVMREHEDIEFKSDKFKEDEMPPHEDYNDVEYLIDRKTLVIRRTLNV